MKHLLCSALILLGLPGSGIGQQDATKPIIPVPPASSAPVAPAQTTPQTPSVAAPAAGTQAQTPDAAGSTDATGTAAAGTPAAVPAPTAPGAASPSYVIGPDDSLAVNVWKEPSVSGNFGVRPDGMISMPLLGDVVASGMTPMALGADIGVKLKKYINDPLVTVTVLTVNSKHFYLQGNVGRPGSQPLTPGITPMQAIIAAGGVTEYGNAKKIYILRTDEHGKTTRILFNFKKAIKDGDQQGVTLQPNDTIVVP